MAALHDEDPVPASPATSLFHCSVSTPLKHVLLAECMLHISATSDFSVWQNSGPGQPAVLQTLEQKAFDLVAG